MSLLALFLISVVGILRQLGGFGLILLGFLDNSVLPLPGSMDALTIILAAAHPGWWWYYGLMAVIGSLVGAWPTYRLGRKGGEAALEKKFPKKKVERVYQVFEKYGALAIVLPALLPPPFPLTPFLAAAGALDFSWPRFFGSLALGRGVRYFLLAWLGSKYSKQIFGFFAHYYQTILFAAIGLAVAGALVALFFYLRHRQKKQAQSTRSKAA